jgi:hypothetical protein
MVSHRRMIDAGFVLALIASGATASAQTPSHQWQFEESSGPATDTGVPDGAPGTLGGSATRTSPGITGNGAVRFTNRFDPGSYVDFGTTAAAFGTSDFTIALRVSTTWSIADTGFAFKHGQLLGTRDDDSGGNYVSLPRGRASRRGSSPS